MQTELVDDQEFAIPGEIAVGLQTCCGWDQKHVDE